MVSLYFPLEQRCGIRKGKSMYHLKRGTATERVSLYIPLEEVRQQKG